MRYSLLCALHRSTILGSRNQTSGGSVLRSSKLINVLSLLRSHGLLDYRVSRRITLHSTNLRGMKMYDRPIHRFTSRNRSKVMRKFLKSPYQALIVSSPGGLQLCSLRTQTLRTDKTSGGIIIGKVLTRTP